MIDTESMDRQSMAQRLIAAAKDDPRIVGLLDYGSSSEGRDDEWSDADVALFIRDDDIEEFERNWQSWAGQLGTLLLAYVGHFGHPWTVYEADPVPLRVDFDLHPESAISGLDSWPNSPTSVEAMLWYDGAGGRLTSAVGSIVGRSLAPLDPEEEFARLVGDFWYHLLYCHCKLQRGELWVARQTFHREVLEPLLWLTRMEAGACAHWQGSQAAKDIELAVTPTRLRQLDECIAGVDPDDLRRSLVAARDLGTSVCHSIACQHGWTWPAELAARLAPVLSGETR